MRDREGPAVQYELAVETLKYCKSASEAPVGTDESSSAGDDDSRSSSGNSSKNGNSSR